MLAAVFRTFTLVNQLKQYRIAIAISQVFTIAIYCTGPVLAALPSAVGKEEGKSVVVSLKFLVPRFLYAK